MWPVELEHFPEKWTYRAFTPVFAGCFPIRKCENKGDLERSRFKRNRETL